MNESDINESTIIKLYNIEDNLSIQYEIDSIDSNDSDEEYTINKVQNKTINKIINKVQDEIIQKTISRVSLLRLRR